MPSIWSSFSIQFRSLHCPASHLPSWKSLELKNVSSRSEQYLLWWFGEMALHKGEHHRLPRNCCCIKAHHPLPRSLLEAFWFMARPVRSLKKFLGNPPKSARILTGARESKRVTWYLLVPLNYSSRFHSTNIDISFTNCRNNFLMNICKISLGSRAEHHVISFHIEIFFWK